MVDVYTIVVFLLIHVAFMVVHKFVEKSIVGIFYVMCLALFLIYYFGISLNDIVDITGALVTLVLN